MVRAVTPWGSLHAIECPYRGSGAATVCTCRYVALVRREDLAMTTNDAAERLRTLLANYNLTLAPELLDQALAAERRATVERIRADILVSLYGDNHEPGPMPPYLAAILDAEAEQSLRLPDMSASVSPEADR